MLDVPSHLKLPGVLTQYLFDSQTSSDEHSSLSMHPSSSDSSQPSLQTSHPFGVPS